MPMIGGKPIYPARTAASAAQGLFSRLSNQEGVTPDSAGGVVVDGKPAPTPAPEAPAAPAAPQEAAAPAAGGDMTGFEGGVAPTGMPARDDAISEVANSLIFDTLRPQEWSGAGGYNYSYEPGDMGEKDGTLTISGGHLGTGSANISMAGAPGPWEAIMTERRQGRNTSAELHGVSGDGEQPDPNSLAHAADTEPVADPGREQAFVQNDMGLPGSRAATAAREESAAASAAPEAPPAADDGMTIPTGVRGYQEPPEQGRGAMAPHPSDVPPPIPAPAEQPAAEPIEQKVQTMDEKLDAIIQRLAGESSPAADQATNAAVADPAMQQEFVQQGMGLPGSRGAEAATGAAKATPPPPADTPDTGESQTHASRNRGPLDIAPGESQQPPAATEAPPLESSTDPLMDPGVQAALSQLGHLRSSITQALQTNAGPEILSQLLAQAEKVNPNAASTLRNGLGMEQ